jgi:hypothetical protein
MDISGTLQVPPAVGSAGVLVLFFLRAFFIQMYLTGVIIIGINPNVNNFIGIIPNNFFEGELWIFQNA